MDNFKSIGQIVREEPEFETVRAFMKDQEVIAKFFDIFPDMREYAEPIKFRKGILTLAVEKAVLRSELKLHELELIKKINSFFREDRVKKIKFQT